MTKLPDDYRTPQTLKEVMDQAKSLPNEIATLIARDFLSQHFTVSLIRIAALDEASSKEIKNLWERIIR